MTNENQGGSERWQIIDNGLGHVSSTTLIDRSITNYWAGVSEKGNRVIPRWDGGQIKREKDIYHHGPRLISIIFHLPDPPCFSLVTIFKSIAQRLTPAADAALETRENEHQDQCCGSMTS